MVTPTVGGSGRSISKIALPPKVGYQCLKKYGSHYSHYSLTPAYEKMARPTENMKKGWSSISSVIDIDGPEPYGRYFGCEHEEESNVKLKPKDHPFSHIFSNSPSVAAVSQHRMNDFWEHYQQNGTWIRHHIYPRKKFFHPRDCENSVPTHTFADGRTAIFDEGSVEIQDNWKNKGEEDQKKWWTGKTIFKSSNFNDPEAKHAAAAKAKPGTHRKKSAASGLLGNKGLQVWKTSMFRRVVL